MLVKSVHCSVFVVISRPIIHLYIQILMLTLWAL